LPAAVTLVGTDRDHAVATRGPIFPLKVDLGSPARGLAVGVDVDGVPVVDLHCGAEQVGRLLGLDDEESLAPVDGAEQGRAVATGIDAGR
jgi:hypothetical protein